MEIILPIALWPWPLTEYFHGCKGGPCMELAVPPSGVDFLEIWKAQPPGTPRACLGHYMDCFAYFIKCLQNTLASAAG
jgi:hypothetical protein